MRGGAQLDACNVNNTRGTSAPAIYSFLSPQFSYAIAWDAQLSPVARRAMIPASGRRYVR